MNGEPNLKEGKKPLRLDHSHPKAITIPMQCCDFAEFLGIYYGDGSATEKPPVVTISLSYSEEREYAFFIRELICSIFRVNAGIVKHLKVNNIQVRLYRITLARFLKTTVNREQGIPGWVRSNPDFLASFIRGVMDCESSIYKVEQGCRRIRIELKMTNKQLLKDVDSGLTLLGYHPRLYLERNRVILAKQDEVDRYFKEIQTHNPKHMKRYLSLRTNDLPNAPVV
jgi:intein/homing endonuclease